MALRRKCFLILKRIGDQLKYASKKGFKVAVIAGNDEVKQEWCSA